MFFYSHLHLSLLLEMQEPGQCSWFMSIFNTVGTSHLFAIAYVVLTVSHGPVGQRSIDTGSIFHRVLCQKFNTRYKTVPIPECLRTMGARSCSSSFTGGSPQAHSAASRISSACAETRVGSEL